MKRILLNESGTFYKINIVFCAELSETNCRAELSCAEVSGNPSHARVICFASTFLPASSAFHHSSIHRSVRPLVDLPFHPSIHPFIHPSIHPFIHPFIHTFIHSSIHLSVRPSVRPSIQPSIHPFIHPLFHPSRPFSCSLSLYSPSLLLTVSRIVFLSLRLILLLSLVISIFSSFGKGSHSVLYGLFLCFIFSIFAG